MKSKAIKQPRHFVPPLLRKGGKIILLLMVLLQACDTVPVLAQEFDFGFDFLKNTNTSRFTPVVYLDTTTKPLTPYGNGWLVFNGVSNLQFARARNIEYAEYIYAATDSFINGGRWAYGLPRKQAAVWGINNGSNAGWFWAFGANAGANILEFWLAGTYYQVDTLSASDSAFHDYRVEFRKAAETLDFYVDGVLVKAYTSVTYSSPAVTHALAVGHRTALASYSDPTTGNLSPNTQYYRGLIDSLYSIKYPGGLDSSVIYGFNEGAGQNIYDWKHSTVHDRGKPDGSYATDHLVSGWTTSPDSQDVSFSQGVRKNTDNTTALSTGLWMWGSGIASYVESFTNGLDTFQSMIIPSSAFNRVNVTWGDWTDNGDTARDIAAWNGSTWSAVGSNTFFPAGSVTQVFPFQNKLYAGGTFTNAGSLANADYIAVYDGSAWDTLAKGFDNSVTCLNSFDGSLIVGGYFNNSGSTSIVSSVAKWNGTAWVAMGTNDIGGVWAVEEYNDVLYAGTTTGLHALWGNTWVRMSALNGATIYCLQNYHNQLWYGGTGGTIGMFNGDTNSMGVLQGFAGDAIEFAVYGNDLYMAGSYYRILYNGVNTVCNKLARWNGREWSAVDYGCDQRMEDLAIWNDKLVVTGDHYVWNGVAHNNINLIDIPYTANITPADTSTYQIETIAYYNRVTSDGGVVKNLAALDSGIVWAKNNGIWDDMRSWVDAEYGVKLGAGDSVIKWYCIFGYDYTGTAGATWTDNSINGNPSLVFNGTNDYLTQANISTGLTGIEVFAVGQRVSDPDTEPNSGFWKYGTSANEVLVPYIDGVVYDDFGANARKTTGNPATSLANVFLYNITSTSSEWTLRINGAEHYTTGTNTVAFRAAPLLGKSDSPFYYDGKFSGIIMMSSCSSDQRTAINSFLNTRYVIY